MKIETRSWRTLFVALALTSCGAQPDPVYPTPSYSARTLEQQPVTLRNDLGIGKKPKIVLPEAPRPRREPPPTATPDTTAQKPIATPETSPPSPTVATETPASSVPAAASTATEATPTTSNPAPATATPEAPQSPPAETNPPAPTVTESAPPSVAAGETTATPVEKPTTPPVEKPTTAPVVAPPTTQPTAPPSEGPSADALENAKLYSKREVYIAMRDGTRLFTAIYSPRDTSVARPILLRRTPYSCRPYGLENFPDTVGPSRLADRDLFHMVVQDVRGRMMSEGEFVDVRPMRPDKSDPKTIDESTDTYDTIEWLLKNIPDNNGKVGMFGISYPGFYTAAGMIDAHPALVAASPQAPIADWFFDDFHHHGAFFLPHFFNFYAMFGRPRPQPTRDFGPRFDHGTPDGYQFFLDLGPLSNIEKLYYKGEIKFWYDMAAHPNRDAFWQARDLLPRLDKVPPAVLTVGGWYDAEDLYGALNVYRATEQRNPGIYNALVMGPWVHGGWARGSGDKLGPIEFGSATSPYYQEKIELAFFKKHLKGEGEFDAHEAYVFETGRNVWRTFDAWPPKNTAPSKLYFREGSALTAEAPPESALEGDAFLSDPNKPVPYTQQITTGMLREYMVEDQRFAARRPDVLVYQTPPLEQELTIAGPLLANLYVSTSKDDADWVVKLIDVFPPDTKDPENLPPGVRLGGYQRMVRSEAFRGRFRESYAEPKRFTPHEPTLVKVPLQDVLHTFGKGHRIMIQVQSTWFPLIDRNPQSWVDNIFEAKPSDFVPATHTVYRTQALPSSLEFQTLPTEGP